MFRLLMGDSPAPRIGRLEALSVPAVQRGRNLICGEISTLPLVLYGPDNNPVRHPLFEQIDPDVANSVTLSQTLEDLLFEGVSWWRITGFGADGYPTRARHLDVTSVTVQPATGRTPAPLPSGIDPRGAQVYVDGVEVPWDELIRFDSLNPGLLKVAGRVIRRALALDKAAVMYAENPRPLDYFTPSEKADPAADERVTEILLQWKRARQQGATAYIPAALEYHPVDVMSPSDMQLAEQLRQVTLEIANAIGLDPEDMGISTTSRTYQNAIDRRYDRINGVMAPYMRAIEQRLSMPDVTKRGYTVRFDLDDYLRADPMTRWKTYEVAKNMGAITVEEIRAEERLPALTPQQKRELTPAPTPAPAIDTEAVEASERARLTLARESGMTFEDMPESTFSVDEESRTITGLAVPYGKVARNQGRQWRFARGSIRWSAEKRVKLLRDHDHTQPLGYASRLVDTPEGLVATFKIARGAAGDEALALAADGVLDGLSIGVDFTDDAFTKDPDNPGTWLVKRAALREVSLTAMPAFDDSRLTSVKAARDEGNEMTDATTEPQAPAAPAVAPDNLEAMFSAWLEKRGGSLAVPADTKLIEAETRPVVNPTRAAATFVNEALPYRFDRGGNFLPTEHVFSADLHSMALANDQYGDRTEAGKRVMGLLRAAFDVDSTDVGTLNPTIQRPDMYVDQRDYRTPLWNFVNKGAPPNGIQPFMFPKFNTASGLVGDHTQGTEPASGTLTTTSQTVTPSAISGKASITREVWDMGGNPAVSTLIFNQMVRGYREGLENATATFLNTLTAATDITLTAGATDEALAAAWDAALADLQFVRNYDFEALALESYLYKAFVAARDTSGRVLYPIVAPQNANGTAQTRFRTLDLGGVTGVPSWALSQGTTAGSPNNSWLFDPSTVHGWATSPQRLEFPGTDAAGDYAPVAMVDLAIWGYKAFACSDIAGVRQVIYDTTT